MPSKNEKGERSLQCKCGYGEGIDDFDEFDAEKFAVSLLGERTEPVAGEA